MTFELAIILLPFIVAACIPIFYRRLPKKVIGWVVLVVPLSLFLLLTTYIPRIVKNQTFSNNYEWIPSFNINFTTYLDGLSLIFSLLITGVGSLVILYSIFYLSKKSRCTIFIATCCYLWGQCLALYFQIIY